MKILYTTTAISLGEGRVGEAMLEDGSMKFEMDFPESMGGKNKDAKNSEQFFALAFAACFHGALKLAAKLSNVTIDDSKVYATVSMAQEDSGGYCLAVKIKAEIPGVDEETGKMLMEKAHTICPFSKATKDNIQVDLELA
ncbi:MAG: Ohr family peroxiredoxin [Armatimonadota bacterium]